VIADVNGDGWPDLVVDNQYQSEDNFSNGSVSVLLNNGNGTFGTAVEYGSGGNSPWWVAVGDLTGNGTADIVVVNETFVGNVGFSPGAVSVLLGNGDGTFQAAATYNSGGLIGWAFAIADVNGDGKPDLVVANVANNDYIDGKVSVLLGNGNGTFQPAVSYSSGGVTASSIAVADVNGDGKPDLVVANPCHQENKLGNCTGFEELDVLLGNGDGTFQAPVSFGTGGYVGVESFLFTSLKIGDLNGDGRPDLVVANTGSNTVGVLLNTFTATTATAVTSSSNPSAINQSVTFTATVSSSSSVPNGATVTFYNNASEIGTGATTNGAARLTASFSSAKTYTIKAKYPGDAFHKASSGTVKQVVNP